MKTRTYTSDFREHFARAEKQLLRRRFLLFSGVLGGLGIVMLLVLGGSLVLQVIDSGGIGTPDALSKTSRAVGTGVEILVTAGVSTMFYVGTFLYAFVSKPSDKVMLQLSLGLVIADGLLNIAIRAFDVAVPAAGVGSFMITHVIACAMLPWTVRQALLASGVVLGVSAISLQLERGGVGWVGIWYAVMGCLTAVPGTLIAWARHSQRLRGHQFRFMQARYGEVRRELTDARRIHEAMFPVPKTHGAVRFTYRYQPMRHIGGDFLHVHHAAANETDDGRLSVVLLDVTGHGIPAALTVNRLFGELERLFAEDPGIAPACVLEKLNRYVHLTMSEHSVFVTALAVRADATRDELEIANAGHPPAFLLSADNRIEQLDSTGMVLGALPEPTHDEGPRRLRFGPGDRLIAYTDGATEARAHDGEMLRIAGLQHVLASSAPVADGSWPMRVLEAVNQHRAGPPDDDTLVVEIYRPVGA